jgi:hypothetical protein
MTPSDHFTIKSILSLGRHMGRDRYQEDSLVIRREARQEMARALLRLREAGGRLGEAALPQCSAWPQVRVGQRAGQTETARSDRARDAQCRSPASKRDASVVLRKPLSSAERRAVEDNLAAQDEALH